LGVSGSDRKGERNDGRCAECSEIPHSYLTEPPGVRMKQIGSEFTTKAGAQGAPSSGCLRRGQSNWATN